MPLKAIAFNCTLKAGDDASSTDKLLRQVGAALKRQQVACEIVRVANFNVKPGVTSDEGPGDGWPALRRKIVEADIFVLGTPIWMGQPSSIAKRVMERLDAFFSEKDRHGRMPSYGKVGLCAIVGNEDGAHHCSAEIFQALNDVGFTLPPNAVTYWVGVAMGDTDYKDLRKTPKVVSDMTTMMVKNAVHLAKALAARPYPGKG
jgi:multimeric flavodoxin WrbA